MPLEMTLLRAAESPLGWFWTSSRGARASRAEVAAPATLSSAVSSGTGTVGLVLNRGQSAKAGDAVSALKCPLPLLVSSIFSVGPGGVV